MKGCVDCNHSHISIYSYPCYDCVMGDHWEKRAK